VQRSSNERVSQEKAGGRLSESTHNRGGFAFDRKVVLALVLFIVVGTLIVYVGFQVLPAPSDTTMNAAMPGMTSSQMGTMPTKAAGKVESMPGMAASDPMTATTHDSLTLAAVRAYFRDHFGGQRYYSLITGYTVDQTSLTIQTNIHGLDPAAMQAGQSICAYASQLMKYGDTAIEHYEVQNHDGARLCSSGS